MRGPAAAAALLAILAACGLDNTAPGNDREAHLDLPAPAAEISSPDAAIAGVATGLLQPESMTQADRANLPAGSERCLFSFTDVGFPAVAYGPSAVIKLNGKLIPLPGAGDGHYAAAGLDVTIRPIEAGGEANGTFPAEFVLMLPGAPNELGFHGSTTCS